MESSVFGELLHPLPNIKAAPYGQCKAFATQVVLPYLQSKMETIYNRHRQRGRAPLGLRMIQGSSATADATQVGLVPHSLLFCKQTCSITVDLARGCWLMVCCPLHNHARVLTDWSCLQQPQSESLWRQIQSQALRLFMRLFPWIHATQEGLKFGYQLLYLLDSTPFYTPVLHLLGQNIVRVSGQEMVSPAATICSLS